MKRLIFILMVLVGFVAKAQLPSSTFPSRIFNGNTKAQWLLLDSPAVNPILDTFYARYPGTQIVRIQGGDTAFWFYGGNRRWFRSLFDRDTVSLSNRINLKLNISDTVGAWLGQATRFVDTMYRVNDSTVGYTIKGAPYTFQILGRLPSGGGGSGTVTSVGLSLPSAFNVTPSTITTSGTFAVTGAGTTLQYIRGNGTLATFDTSAIPDFYLKVRGLLSGTSPITFSQITGAIGINNANNSGTKGAATFNNSSFSDNGAGLISLSQPVPPGTCINCDITWGTDGRPTSYASGTPPNFVNAPGAGDTLSILDTLKRLNAGYGIDHAVTNYNITHSVDTSEIATQYDLTLVNNGLSKDGDTTQLGQDVGASGNPAALNNSREIPLNGYNTVFTGTGGLAIGTTTVGTRKLNISATSTAQGINITTVSGTGINIVSSSADALFAQTGGTGTAITGSNSGTAGYGILAVSSNDNTIPFKTNTFSTLTSSSTPVVAEFVRNVFGVPADGVGLSLMFRGQTTTTTDVETGQIRNYLSTALHGSRSSAWEFHLVNNTVSARKALLASTGQWTWDGYPALTAQVDTTTYKPVAIDGSGNVVKMAGWAGSGGGSITLNNIGTGFAWLATPSGDFKRVANSNTILWDSTSTASSLTAKVDTSLIKNMVSRRTGVLPTMYPGATVTIDTSGKILYAEAIRNNLGSFNGVTDTTAFGKTAAYFDIGQSQALITPSNPTLQGGAKDITIATWVKAATVPGTNMVIAAKDDNRTKRGSEYLLGYVAFGTNKFQWQIEECCHAAPNDGTTWLIASSTPTPSAGQWYFVVGQYDHTAGKIKIWVNMVKDSLTGVPNLSNTTLTPFTIGGLSDDYDTTGLPECCSYWSGAIKSVGYWNRVLDSTELAYLYNNTSVVLPPPGINPGTMSGGPTFSADVPAPLSSYVNSVNYDGVNDRTVMTTGVTLSAGTASLSSWFKADAFGGVIVGRFTSADAYIRVLNSTTIRVQTNVTATFKDYTVPTMSTGTWYNLIVTRGTSNLTHVYLDGAESSSGGQSQTDPMTFDQVAGYWDLLNGLMFDGKISDLRIYESVLSGADITALQTNAATTAVPVLWYKLNEGTGTTNYDYGTAPSPHPFEYSELSPSFQFEAPKTFISWWDLSESEGVRYDTRLRNIIRDSAVTNNLVDISRQNQTFYGSTSTTGDLLLMPTSSLTPTTGATIKMIVNAAGYRAFTAFNSGKVSIGDSVENDNLSVLAPALSNAVSFGLRRSDGLLLAGLSTDVSANGVLEFANALQVKSGNSNPISLVPATGVTVGTARSTSFRLDVLEDRASSDTVISIYSALSGAMLNTTSAALPAIAVFGLADAQRSSGSNPVQNIALYGRARDGQENYSLWLDSGLFKFRNVPGPPSTYNVLVHGLTDSIVYQIPSSALSATTIYNGDGTLATDRNFGSGGFTLRLSGTNNSDTIMSIINAGTSGTGLFASGSLFGIDAQSTNVGLRTFGTVQGLLATGENSYGATIKSNTIAGLLIQSVPATTNTVQEVVRFERGVNGSPGANGIGGSATFYNKRTDNTSDLSNSLESEFTDAVAATLTSKLSIKGKNNGSNNTLAVFDGNGNVTFGTTNSIVGTATNNNAVAGNIGEEISSYTSTYTNYTTTATYQAIDSVTLTAGDWDLAALGTFNANSATLTAGSDAIFVISTTRASATGSTEGKNIVYVPQNATGATNHESISIVPYRVSLSSTTKYYLNTQATFTVGNPQFVGGLRARRVR